MNASFANAQTPLSAGRNDLALYGRFNAMQLGLSYDVMRRWTGSATSFVAQRAAFVPQRPLTADRGRPMINNPYPDEVTVIADTTSGAVAMNLVNYSAHFADSRVKLDGENGTVVYRLRGATSPAPPPMPTGTGRTTISTVAEPADADPPETAW